MKKAKNNNNKKRFLKMAVDQKLWKTYAAFTPKLKHV